MLAFLKRLLWDESIFERSARTFLLSGGAGLLAMALTWTLPPFMLDVATRETWLFVAAAMQGLGGLIPGGQMNKTLPELRQEERASVIEKIIADGAPKP